MHDALKAKRVLVVGGGLSGLTAAYRLQAAGADVTVLERSRGLAGRAVSTRRDGFILDRGADAVTGGYTSYIRLAEDLGLNLRLVTAPAATIRDGRLIAYSGSPASMVRTSLLSWRAKLQIAAGMTRIRSILAGADSTALHRLAELDDPAVSSREYSDRLFGKEATDYLIEPVVRLINGFPGAGASILDVICALSLGTKGNFALDGGIGALSDALAARVNVRRGVEALHVDEEDGGVIVRVQTPQGEETLRGDACVLATMLEQAAEIHAPTACATESMRASLEYVDLIKVQLAYAVPTRSSAFLIQTPVREEPDVMGVFLDHHKHPDRAPAGHSLISVYTDSPAATAWMDRPEENLIAWGQAVAEKFLPELRGHLLFTELGRWPKMAHANRPGFYRDAAAALKALPVGRVVPAGDWFSKTSQDTAIAGGDRAAQALIASWAASRS